jgi:predicted MFS family arabinose efflux permease
MPGAECPVHRGLAPASRLSPLAFLLSPVWLSVVLTLAIQSLVSLVVFTPPVLAPKAEPDIGVAASAVGIVTALVYLSAAFGALSSSEQIVRRGPMRVSQASLLLCGGGIALMASGNLALIAAGALVIGLGYGRITPSSSAILADRAPPHLRSLIFSIKQTGVPIGGAVAGVLVPALILAFGWQPAALIVGALSALLALAVQPWRDQIDRDRSAYHAGKPSGMIGPLHLVLSHPRLREMGLASFSYSGMQMCLASYLVVYLYERAGFSVPGAGAALSTAMAAGIGGRIFWGVVADRWVAPRLLLGGLGVAMSLGAFGMAGIGEHWPLFAVLALSVAWGATAIGWNGVYLAEVARTVPAGQAAAATGGTLAMTYFGVVVLPLMFWALIAATGSYAAAFVALGCLTLWRAVYFFRRG